jgi:sulfite dehydrogenase
MRFLAYNYLSNSRFIALLLLFLSLAYFSCNTSQQKEEENPVKDILAIQTDLPKYDGYELVEKNCVPCHSLRYIEMQPELPKKNWEKIVQKMIKNFGAPIKDSLEASQIVDYLYSIRGK